MFDFFLVIFLVSILATPPMFVLPELLVNIECYNIKKIVFLYIIGGPCCWIIGLLHLLINRLCKYVKYLYEESGLSLVRDWFWNDYMER